MTDESNSSSRAGGPPASESAESDADGRTLTHLDAQGRARMVDVSAKPETFRTATAAGHIAMDAATRRLVAGGELPKGDVLTVARVAAVLAAKRTGELIPLCHPIPLTDVQVDLALDADGVAIRATASCVGRTGVEMEALTAVTVAALTVYDMCKSADRRMVIGDVHLVQKSGGRSGTFRWSDEAAGEDVGSGGG